MSREWILKLYFGIFEKYYDYLLIKFNCIFDLDMLTIKSIVYSR